MFAGYFFDSDSMNHTAPKTSKIISAEAAAAAVEEKGEDSKSNKKQQMASVKE
jgi:hypothetical protein